MELPKTVEVTHQQERKLEGWKRYLAYTYVAVILFDFIIMPIVFEYRRPVFSELAPYLKNMTPEAQLVALSKKSWEPITLSYSAIFHLIMGTILTGVALFNNRFSTTPVASPTQPKGNAQ